MTTPMAEYNKLTPFAPARPMSNELRLRAYLVRRNRIIIKRQREQIMLPGLPRLPNGGPRMR